MTRSQHHRAFLITVFWTLGLLFLGSVVHATESSLACPDWPTCFGTMVPEMTGGVFWEHLHRLVAGGLMLFFCLATYLTWKEEPRYRWLLKASWVGLLLLFVQAALGGITVLFLLPDAVSTSHLGLAFLFLALATSLAVVSSPNWGAISSLAPNERIQLRRATLVAGVLAFSQSLVGAAVRHMDAGVACPDVPLCLGEWIPPFSHHLVILHFGHRVLGFAVLASVLWVGHLAFWRGGGGKTKILGSAVVLVASSQVLLGFLSIYYRLAVIPVSLHTLLAATLLTLLVILGTLTWEPTFGGDPRGREGP
jgi:heme A synthase